MSETFAETFCKKFHGGKCAFCNKRKPKKNSIACKPCGEKAVAEQRVRQAEEDRAAEAEMRFEMLAAFGPGQTVVDITNGRTWRT